MRLPVLLLGLLPLSARAVLRDRSPLPDSPVLGWPQWYRDTNNLPVGLCKSHLRSPQSPADPICFPIDPNPAGFAGNVGDEIFYNILQLDVEVRGAAARY